MIDDILGSMLGVECYVISKEVIDYILTQELAPPTFVVVVLEEKEEKERDGHG